MLYFIPPLYGEGYGVINALLSGNHLTVIQGSMFDLWSENLCSDYSSFRNHSFKSLAMTLLLRREVQGYYYSCFSNGSSLGNAVGKTFNALGFAVNETHFTLIGMAGIVAGVLKTPLTAIFLIAEITGAMSFLFRLCYAFQRLT